ncbi:MAG: GNAT family N-acetyltransferase [Phormidesmis sp.]
MEIISASLEHLEEAATLFDQYRVFYEQPSDLAAARQFLRARFEAEDSAIFLAREATDSVGFAQLYPGFSSVSMRRIWILNDLFVRRSHRNQGIARLLMGAAETYARATGAVRIGLSTQTTNTIAQSLYESLGYRREQSFYHYTLPLV